ncbi:MAG: hypothetical protein IJU23_03195 [Proteobacteria bacterium]|nr:hypothetical protein [Pseudomonadota bacterium]
MKKSRLCGLIAACMLMATGCGGSDNSSADLGKSCTGDEECGGKLVCQDSKCQEKLYIGDNCGFVNTFCSEGECKNGVCTKGEEPPVGDSCSDSKPCSGSQICISNKCEKMAEPGKSCKKDAQCTQGKCTSGTCVVTAGSGQACDGNGRRCSSELECDNGICKKGIEMGGDCRSSLVFCKDGGSCVKGKCEEGSDVQCKDTDKDGIADEWDRCDTDTDKDGTPDCQDLDSDNDTIPDAIEYGLSEPCEEPVATTDGYDFQNTDSDGNGIPDAVEGVKINSDGSKDYIDSDNDGLLDSSDPDNDNDNINDTDEIYGLVNPKYASMGEQAPRGADCYNAKQNKWGPYTDENGVERMGDGQPDTVGSLEKPFDCDGDTIPDYLDTDSDSDGIPDAIEYNTDSDDDGYFDRYELDSDNDGIPDRIEAGDNPKEPSVHNEVLDFKTPDIDKDGLLDGLEVVCVTEKSCENADEKYCVSKCVDLKTDNANCGDCGNVCKADHACEEGVCVLKCEETEEVHVCGDDCVDFTVVNNYHCGSCENRCNDSQKCVKVENTEEPGMFVLECQEVTDVECTEEGKNLCWGACVNKNEDANNCGECGNVCESGSCVDGVCAPKKPVELSYDSIDGRYVADSDGDGIGDALEYIAAQYKCMTNENYEDNPENFTKFCSDSSDKYMTEFICDKTKGAVVDPEKNITEGAFDFYFVLPHCGDKCIPDKCGSDCYDEEKLKNYKKTDKLKFRPEVSKLDVVFSLDTTNSMGAEVANLKQNIDTNIIPKIRSAVTNSAFGVVRFDDFPTRPTIGGSYDYLKGTPAGDGGYGHADQCGGTQSDPLTPFLCDVPFQLLGQPEPTIQFDNKGNIKKDSDGNALIDQAKVKLVSDNVKKLSLHHGGDIPEAGYESLWQIVKGDVSQRTHWTSFSGYAQFAFKSPDPSVYDVQGNENYINKTVTTDGRWGGAKFRDKTLPVVVHITDAPAHDNGNNCMCDDDKTKQTCTCKPYDPAFVDTHYHADVHAAYKEKGARIISVFDAGENNVMLSDQLVETSRATDAIVPVCAFMNEDQSWNECKVTINGHTVTEDGTEKCQTRAGCVDPVDGKCVLSYSIMSGDKLSDTLVSGVDALVKYSVSDVAAVIKRDEETFAKSNVDTSCFIKSVEALEYIAPPNEPEKTCNPTAKPAMFDGATYNNGFTNFAIGTSSSAKEGAQLHFTVTAMNDDCVAATSDMQVFEATIELINPTTGMSYGEHKVSIVVPGVNQGAIN